MIFFFPLFPDFLFIWIPIKPKKRDKTTKGYDLLLFVLVSENWKNKGNKQNN